jgi:hypothetical protein
MTHDEISKLSDNELNELIAKQRGIYVEHSEKYECPVYLFNGGVWTRCPNFVTDGNLTVKLLEEMPVQTKLIKFEDEGNGKEYWECSATDLSKLKDVAVTISLSLGRAIAEAYAIMECVG